MAGPVNPTALSHSPVTQFTDGTAIPVGTITKYQYGFGSTSGQYTTIKDDLDLTSDASGKQTYAVPVLAFGDWFSAARAVTKDGATAAWGNETAFTLAPKVPKPITDFASA
jgi:hypothetical protein